MPLDHSRTNAISGTIVDAAVTVHRALGPGLLESTYATCLAHEIGLRGLSVERDVGLPLVYRGVRVSIGYRMDLVVEQCVVVELKAVAKLHPVHDAQLLSYLRLSGYRVGLLINFNVPLLRDGLRRLVNAYG